MSAELRNQRLSTLWSQGLAQVLSDWGAMVGLEASCSATTVEEFRRAELLEAELPEDAVAVCARIHGSCEGPLAYFFDGPTSASIAGAAMMLSDEGIEERIAQGPCEEDWEALREMVNLMLGSLSVAMRKTRTGLSASQRVDDYFVAPRAECGPELNRRLGTGPTIVTRHELSLGPRSGRIWACVPSSFGAALAMLLARSAA